MTKCRYCDYEYESIDDLYQHLNATHTKCICGKVSNNRIDNYALYDDCLNKNESFVKLRTINENY